MFRFRVLALSACVLAVGGLFVHAQEDELKAVLRKAIEAQGGKKTLDKLGATSKFKGTIELMGQTLDLTGESAFQRPDKIRNSIVLNVNNMEINVVVVYDGKTMWQSINSKTEEIKNEKIIEELRQSVLTEGAGVLPELLKKPYELSAVGEVKVKDEPAIGIRVSKKGQRDITFYFDKKTHLVVKTETRAYDALTDKEITQEKYLIGYRDVNGVKQAKRLVIHKDGDPYMDLEISDIQTHDKLDDSHFAKP